MEPLGTLSRIFQLHNRRFCFYADDLSLTVYYRLTPNFPGTPTATVVHFFFSSRHRNHLQPYLLAIPQDRDTQLYFSRDLFMEGESVEIINCTSEKRIIPKQYLYYKKQSQLILYLKAYGPALTMTQKSPFNSNTTYTIRCISLFTLK